MVIFLKGKMKRKPDCRLSDEILRVMEKVKFIGVVWEGQWRVRSHLDEVKKKAHDVMCKVERLFGGRHYKVVKKIYEGFYVPIVCKGVGVWGQEVAKTLAVKILSKQSRTLLMMLGGYKTISTDAAAVLAGILPLDGEMKKRWAVSELRRRGSIRFQNERNIKKGCA